MNNQIIKKAITSQSEKISTPLDTSSNHIQNITIILEEDSPKETHYIALRTINTPNTPLHILDTLIEKTIYNNNTLYTIHKTLAEILLLANTPQHIQNSYRTGLVFIYADLYNTICTLLFEGILYGLFSIPTTIENKTTIAIINDCKNSWFPDEEIIRLGGYGHIYSHCIPSDAIFSATYIAGSNAKNYTTLGTIVPPVSLDTLYDILPIQ